MATELKQIYKCNVCSNMVEVVHAGVRQLVCCGQPMELKTANTQEAATEKHTPVIEKSADKIIVKVGSVPHPMEEKHYIEWIELIVDGQYCCKFLKPGDASEAEFCVIGENVSARAYCNLHGLWQS